MRPTGGVPSLYSLPALIADRPHETGTIYHLAQATISECTFTYSKMQ